MRTHTSEFKEKLKVFGRQIKGKITYYPSYDLVSESDDNILTEADLQIISEQANYDEPIEISEEDIFSISIIKNGDLLQSLMKEFDFETKVELNIGSVVNPQFGLLVNNEYEYLDYGNYIINSKEFNMDTETWSYVCYDKMLFSMVKYRGLSNIEYPITIKQYINLICNKIGLEFEDSDFVNQNQLIYEDLYKNRDVTYRDIFDEISKIVAGNLLINNDDKVEVGYVKNTVGKNLFDKNAITNLSTFRSTATINNDKSITITSTGTNGYAIIRPFFDFKANKTYTISFDVDNVNKFNHMYLFVSTSSTAGGYSKKPYVTITRTSDVSLGIGIYPNANETITISNIQIEENSSATEYEEYGLDKINEDYLKDTNVRMSEKIGVINSVAILDGDNNLQYIAEDTQSIKENQMTRVTITDNLIAMNGETQEIADNILNKLNGLYYYANDLQTTGVCYYDFLDMFNVEARGNVYQCLLLNNEITITQGIEEHIFTEKFEEIETSANEYTTSVMTNKQIQFNINQQEGKIESKVEKDGVISAINQSAEEIQINADKLSFEGATINMTADNVKIKGDNLEIDSDGTITLYDNSATSSLNPETLHSAYIIKSTDTVERAGTTETLSFKNEIVANGRRITLEDNWEYQGTIGGGKAGITEGIYSQPRLTFYSQSNDYESTTGSGSYQDLDISLIAGIKYTNIQNGTTSTPLIITPSGNITCVSLTQTSKEENKKNFEKLINAKDILNNVDIYKYNYINEDNKVKKSIGFVIGDDFNYSEEITSQNNDGANIYSMVSVLWQVVKEQQEEINELKEMIKNGKY